jgi:hypothetical protein
MTRTQLEFWCGSQDAKVGGEIRLISAQENAKKEDAKGCFIATAAYGSDIAPEVTALRGFRDTVLLQHSLGRCLRYYYAASPPMAFWIKSRPLVRTVVRSLFFSPLLASLRGAGLLKSHMTKDG